MRKGVFFLWFLVPFVFSVLAYQGFGFVYKAAVTLSCLLIIGLGWKSTSKKHKETWLIVAAFVLSIVGDWFLSNKGQRFQMFAAGIGFYFLAHVGYLTYALQKGSLHKLFTFVLLSFYLLFFALVLWPAIDNAVLLFAVLGYLLISCLSLGAAINLNESSITKTAYFFGVALILLSDTIISFKEFTSYQSLNFLILPTYYAAHMVISFAVVKAVKD